MKVKPPRRILDLGEFGITPQQYLESQRWFLGRNITCGYSTQKRSWNFACVGRKNGPTYVICWVGIEAFAAMLQNRIETAKQMYARGANVRVRKEML